MTSDETAQHLTPNGTTKMTTATNSKIINISINGTHAGAGEVRYNANGEFIGTANCSAQFCDDNDESSEIYELIDEAIANGKSSIRVELNDGSKISISWEIGE